MISTVMETLRQRFDQRLLTNEPLARLTSARLGGAADYLLVAETASELAEMAAFLWEHEMPFLVLGGGSNVLVSDAGVRGVVILNRARQVHFDNQADNPTVWVESGANFGSLARQACARGLSGLEWAIGIPGTVGGAVVGNAGAHGGDMAGSLILAEILHHRLVHDTRGVVDLMKETWPVERFEYQYRSSLVKRQPGEVVILGVTLRLAHNNPEAAMALANTYNEQRRRSQPPGATMGSMFKNPPGDYAGRLIDEAGLKRAAIGDAEISHVHANFFINRGHATAQDVFELIKLAQKTVLDKFGVQLELEIELIGEWQ
jgi:UDP-N-acetylmuramate dehydrogenase